VPLLRLLSAQKWFDQRDGCRRDVLRNLSCGEPSVGGWLLARCHSAGFSRRANAPMPDLLSTADGTARAGGMQVSFEQLNENAWISSIRFG